MSRIPLHNTRLAAALRAGISADSLTRNTERALDSTIIDSISKNLINDLYTSTSSSVKSKVTLDDVLALRPANREVSPDEFNKIKDAVASSFNVGQLKGVLRAQSIPANGKKSVLVNQIMLLMDLEVVTPVSNAPPVVEDPYSAADAYSESEEFPSSRRELFFILGSDGASRRQLEKEKGVRISINIEDETYTIRGSKESIQDAKAWIQERVAVTEEAWDVSTYSNRSLVMTEPSELEEIARRSETFVSASNEHTLVISGRSDKDMEEAKRLFDLKLQKPLESEMSLLLNQDDELSPLGLFPVFDSITMSADENRKSFHRICQTKALAETPKQRIYTFLPVHPTPSSIEDFGSVAQHLQSFIDGARSSNQVASLEAHYGQLLFRDTDFLLARIPRSGSFDSMELQEWLKDAERPYFFDSLPFYKTVSKLPLVGPKSKSIEVEYTPSAGYLDESVRQQDGVITSGSSLSPIRIIFELNNEGLLCIKSAKTVNKQVSTNIMMLGQPTDIQVRSEMSTALGVDSPSLSELLSRSELLFADKLQCPSFFSFKESTVDSTPAAAQLGLGSTFTHTLSKVLFRTTGVFDYRGLPLVASEVGDQYGQVCKQELKLLTTPLKSIEQDIQTDGSVDPAQSEDSASEDQTRFIRAAVHLAHSI
ncbi:hypothetical protein BGZ70_006128 [Mortierella alpina]|uniref:SAP domain-containing protein n=1 Tax=Mortierella alpina TaxID=64518 RepID=A0A9P6M448_MORAP|nr:hypothetical protein BGZ70_006128 [Mortierella alpina]